MDSFALVSILCSQFVALFQMLGVLNTLSVAWPEPFSTDCGDGDPRELPVGGLERWLRLVNAAVAPIRSQRVLFRLPHSVHGGLSLFACDGLPLRPVQARSIPTVFACAVRGHRYSIYGCLHLGVLCQRTASAVRRPPKRPQHHAGVPPSDMLAFRRRPPKHVDDWCLCESHSIGVFVPVHVGHCLLAEATV